MGILNWLLNRNKKDEPKIPSPDVEKNDLPHHCVIKRIHYDEVMLIDSTLHGVEHIRHPEVPLIMSMPNESDRIKRLLQLVAEEDQ